MNETDNIIRDIAKSQGNDNLSNEQLHEVKSQLSNTYIDDVLDGRLDQPAGGSDGKA